MEKNPQRSNARSCFMMDHYYVLLYHMESQLFFLQMGNLKAEFLVIYHGLQFASSMLWQCHKEEWNLQQKVLRNLDTNLSTARMIYNFTKERNFLTNVHPSEQFGLSRIFNHFTIAKIGHVFSGWKYNFYDILLLYHFTVHFQQKRILSSAE